MVEDRVEKCKCGLAVWRHEGTYDTAIGFIDKRDKNWALTALESLQKNFDDVASKCAVDVKDAKEKILDAKWHIERDNWMDAKWDLLFASAKLLDEVKACAQEKR